MEICLIAGVFVVMALTPLIIKNINWIATINILGCLLMLLITLNISGDIYTGKTLSYLKDYIYIDSLSLIQLLIITTITFIASAYSYKYIKEELEENMISLRRARVYYLLISCFMFSMMFLCLSNNVMGMWIGLEATTISTAFLIGFSRDKLSLEAAWKYIIICSTGIGLGFVGIILFIYSAGGQANGLMLNWTYLLEHHSALDKEIAKIAFVFIFVGIGTKAGLAPMHTWLSDGHSEAPSPISAMMSGVLLNLAIYVIVRFYIIIRVVSDTENLRYLFVVFGCISLVVSAFSILKQNNYKRLLAFSSVENIGIITLGIGIGGIAGAYGALLHSVIHALGKTLLFLVAGNILSVYKTKRIDKISGLIKTMPNNAVFFVLGMLVITGAPPFASFFSEYKILIAGIEKGYYLSIFIYTLCILLVFAGFLNVIIKMVFETDNIKYITSYEDSENILPVVLTFTLIVLLSITFVSNLSPILNKAAMIIAG
jgi:hydrogenase-4 component F